MPEHVSGASLKRQVIFWLLVLAGLVLFLMVFSSILLPFVAGMALAYFLDPVADRLERLGLSRLMATVTILLTFILLLVIALLILIPVLARQASDLASRLPDIVANIQLIISQSGPDWLPDWARGQIGNLKENFSQFIGQGAGLASAVVSQIWSSGKALINIVSLFLITPVVAFYILLDWDHMVERVDGWVPRDYLKTVREIAAEMDGVIAGFVRGQGSLCLILGFYYASGLSVVGVNFGLLIGMLTGLFSFIPYVGSMTGFILALGVALVEYWPDSLHLGLVVLVFLVGQFLEGNVLQPRLVGKSVGLHPVWLMFALFAFGALFGFVGLLVAVPASAAIGVLVRFAIDRYMQSDLYFGRHGNNGQGQAITGKADD